MKQICSTDFTHFKHVRFVLTDLDDTLTYRGRLSAETYTALERLQKAGVKVIPVTAAPAGWCDQMARMWPVDGVIGENGGIFFRRKNDGHGIEHFFWHDKEKHSEVAERLKLIGEQIKREIVAARFADDQPFRMTSIAFSKPQEDRLCSLILDALVQAGAATTVNNLWILGWLGKYDKLSMARRILRDFYALDIDFDRSAILYSGDSTNDAPMFSFFEHTVGVSTVTDYLDQIPQPPQWITCGPGGAGFVEIADAIIASR
ncbi:HAD-IIB family hydrolase [Klebsiella indica]|uniref:HAD-IIB family hydrolase n=1 Tax=Klebsiella indica TaxID=2582917 RepID=A0A5R9LI23_9ENTR|nr:MULTISPECIES: HAD-IIB family hydrolase [Klebsiella]TLV18290.1 HAD-IIB family hydrolase [Klebsiella indica]